jgi:regulator of RNase E activity RraA
VVLGRAMTVLEADIDVAIRLEDEREELRPPFGLMFRALDDLRRHEVYVCSGASPRYALWGELMSLRAQQCGATGAVVDGYSRDTHGILKLAFPVFSTGSYAQDQGPRGKVIDFRCGLEIEGVRIADGDILFGDIDGVLVIPRAIERDCLTAALAKVRSENLVRAALLTGMTTAEAFQRFGVM